MKIDRYRLLSQLGAGADGAAYRARDQADGSLVEVRLLEAARADAGRWPALVKRLRIATLLEEDGAVRVRGLGLESDPPWVALEWFEHDLADDVRERLPLPPAEAAAVVRDLAVAVAEAHRVGLVHGRLGPDALASAGGLELRIDFTGTATRLPRDELAALIASCQAPELAAGHAPDFAADVYSLGALLFFLLAGKPLAGLSATPLGLPQLPPDLRHRLNELLGHLLAADPLDRPAARAAADQLDDLLGELAAPTDVSMCPTPPEDLPLDLPKRVTVDASSGQPTQVHRAVVATADAPAAVPLLPEAVPVQPVQPAAVGRRLGRFHLLEKLGEGGMGSVYRAEDVTDGTVVAVKVLSSRMAERPAAVKRFHKEARLLAEVNNPYVANLLEVNEDDGVLYLAMEFVPGQSLDKYLARKKKLDEQEALAIVADVCRALVEPHQHGIVHRDIKPDNILLAEDEASGGRQPPVDASRGLTPPARHRVKLTDFGLARHVVESESLNVTRAGAVVGTPLYMAPEQCTGASLDPRTDVYGLGATLYHLLAGRPPFVADSPLVVMAMHTKDPPPPLRQFNPGLSDAVCHLVEKALAKAPDARYADAAALLQDLERLLRGEPTSIAVHPALPACDPHKVLHYDWTWELEATPEQLWPHVSNTERLNRAVGLPAVHFSAEPDPEAGVRRHGELRKLGMTAAWREYPFEWIEGRRMGVLREFSQGPFKWFISIVELAPRPGGGTTLAHHVRIEPVGLLGRTAAAVEVSIKGRRALDRVYRRIDAAQTGKLGKAGAVDPFEEPAALSGARQRRLDALLERLSRQRLNPTVLDRLGAFLEHAPAQEAARIRPLALARRLGLDPDALVAACLHGAREGLLVLLWDILCPVCRIPSEVKDTLRVLKEHGRCEACQLDFELDFANSVELIFRAHPEIREADTGTYCIGGPAHSPHVAAQVRLAAGERLGLELALPEGSYRLRGPQLPFVLDFRVLPSATVRRWDLNLLHGPPADLPRELGAGRQTLALVNDTAHELMVRVERTAPRADALTAARASSLALFRELFPGEVLSPGQLVSVANVTLLTAELDGAGRLYEELGDAQAFARVHEFFRLADGRIRQEGGALVKTVGEGLLASFPEPAAALRAGLDLQGLLAGGGVTAGLRVKAGVHRGPALVATLNDHLDYFGITVNQAVRLPELAGGGEVVLTAAVTADPAAAALLQARGLDGEVFAADLPGEADSLLQRVRVG